MTRLSTAALLACIAAPAAAQAGAPAPEPPQAAATRAAGAIRVDGALDEEAWAAATLLTGFRQLDPAEGEPATERTEVRILYDDQALYVGARLYDRQPVSARLGRRVRGRRPPARTRPLRPP